MKKEDVKAAIEEFFSQRAESHPATGQFVLVRCYSAGVHMGVLRKAKGKDVELMSAQRLHRWNGANTLNEVAVVGAAQSFTRISEAVREIYLSDVIEIIPCTPEAQANLIRARWGG